MALMKAMSTGRVGKGDARSRYLGGMSQTMELHASEAAPYYLKYIALCPPADGPVAALEAARARFVRVMADVPAALGDHRYAPGKWTIKDVIQHLIDCERVFAYRALRFARADTTGLSGFDQNSFAANAATERRALDELLAEHAAVRAGTIALFRSFDAAMLLRIGTANGNPFSVRALGWAIAGHEHHHLNVIEQRYLQHG